MLGLATHEPNFTIVREEFVYGKPKPCPLCGFPEHELIDCLGLRSFQITRICLFWHSCFENTVVLTQCEKF